MEVFHVIAAFRYLSTIPDDNGYNLYHDSSMVPVDGFNVIETITLKSLWISTTEKGGVSLSFAI